MKLTLSHTKGTELYKKAKALIPGGTQLLSKRPEMLLPERWPSYYSKSKGCTIWDLDNNAYEDFLLMGVGANVLGFADDDVDNAVIDVIRKGSNTTLNAPEEVEFAQKITNLHPWADSVRYTKTGGEAMAVAVRIARAHKNKEKVLFCGYHGWHDWYLAANLAEDDALDGHLLSGLEPNGVPRALQGSSIPFKYNDIEGFLKQFEEHKNELACVVLESVRNFEPNPEFLMAVREQTAKSGVVLIVDEITAGFRLNIGGAHLRYDLEPDIAVFGKAISNGYPFASIIGKKHIMDAAQQSFISSLCWTDRIGLAAALATISKMEKLDSPKIIQSILNKLKNHWTELFTRLGMAFEIIGAAGTLAFTIKNVESLAFKTLITQEMFKKNFLAATVVYPSIVHIDALDNYFEEFTKTMSWIDSELKKGKSEEMLLEGPICHAGFQRLT